MFLFGILLGSGALVWAIAQAILESLPPEPGPPVNRVTPLWAMPENMVDAQRRRNQQLIADNLAAMTQNLTAPGAPLPAPPGAPPGAPLPAPPGAPLPAPLPPDGITPPELEAIRSWVRMGLSKNEAARSLGIPKGNSSRYQSFSRSWDQEMLTVSSDLENAAIKAIEQALRGTNAVN